MSINKLHAKVSRLMEKLRRILCVKLLNRSVPDRQSFDNCSSREGLRYRYILVFALSQVRTELTPLAGLRSSDSNVIFGWQLEAE